MIKEYCNNKAVNSKSTLKYAPNQVIDVPKIFNDCKDGITENPLFKNLVTDLKGAVSKLDPLNTRSIKKRGEKL